MYIFEEGIVKRTTNDCRAFERIPRDFHLFTNRIKVLERSVAQTFGVVVFKKRKICLKKSMMSGEFH